MKKRLLMLFVIFASVFVLVGCGKKTIVGTWTYEEGNFSYTFKEDGSGFYDVVGTSMNFTYKVDGNKLSILYEGNTESFDTEYRIEDNKLIIKDSFDQDTVYIRK